MPRTLCALIINQKQLNSTIKAMTEKIKNQQL